MMRKLLLILALLWAVPSMATAPTKVGTCATGQTTFGMPATSKTFSITVPSGANALYVGASIDSATETVTGVTFNGVAMTAVGSIRANTSQYIRLWILVAPDITTANIVVTASGSVDIEAGGCSFQDVNQATPTANFTSQSKSFADISAAVTSTTNDLVVDMVRTAAGTNPTKGASQTILWQPAPNVYGWGASSQGGTNPTMGWSTSATTATWAGFSLQGTASTSSSGGAMILGMMN